ncbi:hypothetical protein [Acaryochloris thomasi]|nr:hypothetical protein [Acaryochloris thomasi]
MTISNNPESFEAQVLKRLDKIDTDIKTTNERISTYWEASKLLVNLAFGLIATAVLAILVRAAVGG